MMAFKHSTSIRFVRKITKELYPKLFNQIIFREYLGAEHDVFLLTEAVSTKFIIYVPHNMFDTLRLLKATQPALGLISTRDIVASLVVHEFVHIKQQIRGDLAFEPYYKTQPGREPDKVVPIWRGIDYPKTNQLLQGMMDGDPYYAKLYTKLPWEVEAYKAQRAYLINAILHDIKTKILSWFR